MKKILITMGALSSFMLAVAQGNTCGTATTITPNASCSYTSGTTVGATYQSNAANGGTPSCASPGAPDVWYTFTAGSSGNFTIDTQTGTITDGGMSLYSGTCGSLTEIACDDDSSPNGLMPQITANLTAGTTYYIRFWAWGGTNTGTFGICVTTPPTPPSNDNCGNAITAPVNPGVICSSVVSGTIAGATASSQATGCSGTADDDVWYSFTATNATQYINLNNVTGSTTDMYFSVYGGTCGSIGAPLLCSDPESGTVSGLTPGNTYYVRIYSWTSTAGQNSTFDLCIGSPPSPPSNDNCGGSTPLTSSTGCNSVLGTIAGATASPQTNACGGTADDDVWYSFVATSAGANITLSNVTGSTTDLYHSVYSGTCGSIGTPIVCSDPNTSAVTGLIPGNTYYVRVYTYTSTGGQTSQFSICVTETGACGTPNNQDYCVAPALLTPGAGNFSSNTSGTYTSDTPANLNSVFCGSIENNSWYQFTATSSTATFNFTAVGGGSCSWGVQAQVYNVTKDVNGCCTNFTSVSNCFNPGTASTGTVTATGLTVGNTYLLMIDGNAGSVCNFTISGWSATGILGVSLTDFHLLSMENGNDIRWETATEKDNDYFVVQRSTDGVNFMDVQIIDGAGTKVSPTTYKYFDAYRLPGIVYYRLKQVDLDNTFTYSERISIARNNTEVVSLYPNPVKDLLTLTIEHQEPVEVQIYNTNGTLIKTVLFQGEGFESQTIQTDQLNKGLYFMHFVTENEVIIDQKFIKN